jgi:DNA-binding response OmpR family regulator
VPETTVRLLLVEDNAGDADLVREMLSRPGEVGFDIEHSTRLAGGLKLLAQDRHDAVLLDLNLPDSAGLDTFRAVHLAAPDVPTVVLTGSRDEGLGVEAVRAGAQDYLVKGRIDAALLTRALRYAIERKRAEAALRASEERYR